MKHLVICSTPLQLITTIHMKCSLWKHADVTLYILDHSHMHEEMYQKAQETTLFSSVRLLKVKYFNKHWLQKYKMTRYMVKGWEYFLYRTIAKKLIDDRNIYDTFWVSFMDRSSWLIFMAYKQKNPLLELNFFEDGIGSYRLLSVKQNRADAALLHLLGKKSVFEEMKALFLYEPSLASNDHCPHVTLKPLEKINNPETKQILNNVFSIDSTMLGLLKYKFLFFDSPFLDHRIQKTQRKFIYALSDKLGKNICIKLHPATLFQKETLENIEVSDVKIGMEMLCLNADLSNKVLISVLSTVGITPKIMFDQEPVVIFLYKLVDWGKSPQVSQDFFEFVERFKKTYSDPERILIPETMDEFEKMLETLQEDRMKKWVK